MTRKGHENIKFFIGNEIEHTPAFTKKTLFVVGKVPVLEIFEEATKHKVQHIFLGANKTFSLLSEDDEIYWDSTATYFLDRGFWVTIDYPATAHEQMLNILSKGVWACRRFVPLVSVAIPNIESSGPNLTIKIDDSDFNASNIGVWCYHFSEMTDSNRLTLWDEYGTDQVITTTAEVTDNQMDNFEPEPVVIQVQTDDMVTELARPLNDQSLGIDPIPTPVTEETVEPAIITDQDTIEAYTEKPKTARKGKAPKKEAIDD